MKNILFVGFFLHTISNVFGRPDYTLDDPKTRFSRNTDDEDIIIFPHEAEITNRFHGADFKMPKIKADSCENGICEEVDDYPYEFIDKVLSKSKEFQAYFANQLQEESFSVSNRNGGNAQLEGESLCKSIISTKYPKVGRNLNGTNITVVNDDKFQQVVLTETCESNNGTCRFAEAFPYNYESGCKQKFINHRLMAFNGSGYFTDLFPIASCCVCYIKKKAWTNN